MYDFVPVQFGFGCDHNMCVVKIIRRWQLKRNGKLPNRPSNWWTPSLAHNHHQNNNKKWQMNFGKKS
jgi:hypothetical protein